MSFKRVFDRPRPFLPVELDDDKLGEGISLTFADEERDFRFFVREESRLGVFKRPDRRRPRLRLNIVLVKLNTINH